MEISKEYLEEKLKRFTTQRDRITEQVNQGISMIQRVEGAIDTIKLLLEDLNKVDIEVKE